MKFLLFILLIPVLSFGQAEMKLDHKTHKFPKTKEGVILEHDFPFTNTGDAPLIINKYDVACSCTKATYPTTPIMPGESGVIHVTFDTKGKISWQDRTIQLFTSTPKTPITIRFKVMVDND